MGARQHARDEAEDLAALEPDSMRDYLLKHPLSRGGRAWCDRVLEGVNKGERTSLRLYAEAMRWVGAQGQIALVFLQSLGLRDEIELRSLLEGGRRLENLRADLAANPRELLDSALEAAAMVLAKHPEWRAGAVARLDSFAEEAVEVGPGKANGNGTHQDSD